MAGPATELGLDRSGNGNNFTVAGTLGSDQMVDTPTNNFCTVNPLDVQTADKLKEGNLQLEPGNGRSRGTFAVTSGKWYFEVLLEAQTSSTVDVGISGVAHEVGTDDNNEFVRIQHPSANGNGVKINIGGTTTDNQGSVANGNIIGCFFDMDAEEVSFLVNNSAIAASCTGADFSGLTNKDMMTPHIITGGGRRAVANFGQDSSFNGAKTAQGNQDDNDIGDFYYAPPSGFLALCTKNLSEPAITPSEHFNSVLYTGNGGTPSITGVGFQSGFTWIKARSEVRAHYHFDEVRGVQEALSFDAVGSQDTSSAYLTAFGADGFSLGNSVTVNKNTITYAAWNWKIGGDSGSSNTNGSINTTSTSVNSDAGISISTYTGNATSGATVGHGLSKTPEWIIVSNRGQNGGHNQFHTALGPTKTAPTQSYEPASTSSNIWNDTAPTASVFSLGNNAAINGNNNTYVAYCFHGVDGYSKFGNYMGTGSNDGPFVHCGFRPAFIILKNTAAYQHYVMYDVKRSTTNLVDNAVYTDVTEAESSAAEHNIDILSNGFKVRNNAAQNNTNANLHIFMAFAEIPFKYSNAR